MSDYQQLPNPPAGGGQYYPTAQTAPGAQQPYIMRAPSGGGFAPAPQGQYPPAQGQYPGQYPGQYQGQAYYPQGGYQQQQYGGYGGRISHPPPQLPIQRTSVVQRTNGGFSNPLAGDAMSQFGYGFKFYFGSMKFLLTRPRLWPHLIAPVVFTLLVLGGLVALGAAFYVPVTNAACGDGSGSDSHNHPHTNPYSDNTDDTPDMSAGCKGLMVIGCLLAILLATYVALKLAVKLFGVCMSREVERIEIGEAVLGACVSVECLLSPCLGLFDMVVEVVILVLCALPNVIPAVGQLLALVCTVTAASLIGSKNVVECTVKRREHGMCEGYRVVLAHKALWVGFGAGMFICSIIPIFQIPAMICGVVGATRIYIRLEYHGHVPGVFSQEMVL